METTIVTTTTTTELKCTIRGSKKKDVSWVPNSKNPKCALQKNKQLTKLRQWIIIECHILFIVGIPLYFLFAHNYRVCLLESGIFS